MRAPCDIQTQKLHHFAPVVGSVSRRFIVNTYMCVISPSLRRCFGVYFMTYNVAGAGSGLDGPIRGYTPHYKSVDNLSQQLNLHRMQQPSFPRYGSHSFSDTSRLIFKCMLNTYLELNMYHTLYHTYLQSSFGRILRSPAPWDEHAETDVVELGPGAAEHFEHSDRNAYKRDLLLSN